MYRQWRAHQRGAVFLARYAAQQRSEIRAMPMSTFRAWLAEAAEFIQAGG